MKQLEFRIARVVRTLTVMLCSLLLTFSVLFAQDKPTNKSPNVVAAPTDMGVRFTAPGEIGEIRLEVFSQLGEKVFDSDFQRGNVLDWSSATDLRGQMALSDEEYLFLLTLRDLSGRVLRRHVSASMASGKVTHLIADSARITPAQTQALSSVSAIGVEGESEWVIISSGQEAAALTTHDRADGQVTSTKGALTFRTGNLFAGKDVEIMRITPEGNVGIGTDKPMATLDVAGAVRANEGFRFSDGTSLNAQGGRIMLKDGGSDSLSGPLAVGTGTANQVAKWLETGGAGTLGDSALTELGGNVGIGTTTPANLLEARSGQPDLALNLINPVNFSRLLFKENGSERAAFQYIGSTFPTANRRNAMEFFNNFGPVLFFTASGGAGAERLRIDTSGNIGVGTTVPTHKLDVTGNINTSTEYRLGGQAVLRSSAASANLFVGVNAGLNTAGLVGGNAFFGTNAGLNTAASSNAFFGTSAGDTNVSGTFNTIIGTGADVGPTNLINATAIGQRALVTQSNSLVLGSINGQNGSTADTNVGVGTTAPLARLHLVGTSTLATSPIAILQSSGGQMPLSFRFGNTEAARIRANDFGNLVFATLNGTDKNIFFRAGDDSGTDMFIQSSTGNVGIGTTSPEQKLEVSNGAVLSSGATGGRFTTNNPNNQSAAAHFDWFNNTARIRYGGSGVGATNGFVIQGQGDATKLQIRDDGDLLVSDDIIVNQSIFLHNVNRPVGGAGALFDLCVEDTAGGGGTLKIALCNQSSIRYKKDVRSFTPGLQVLGRLRPVSFRWKNSGREDVGLVAEEVARVEPLLALHNAAGEVEGVKYDRIAVLLINAVHEQQTQIRSHQAQIKEQRSQLRMKDLRIASLEDRLARYESSVGLYEARLASLERSVAKVKRATRRTPARNSQRKPKFRRAGVAKME